MKKQIPITDNPGDYPEEYHIFKEKIVNQNRPGQVFKKKRQDIQFTKVSKSWMIFWDIIEDDSPKCCFMCGYYIAPSQRQEPDVKQPFKLGDLCHVLCFNNNIKMDDVTKKLNPKSNLICHIDVPTATNQILCRKRVFNDPSSILTHLYEHKGLILPNLKSNDDFIEFWNINMNIDWKVFRNENFLKPNGEPFKL